jgi:hypothetical protein
VLPIRRRGIVREVAVDVHHVLRDKADQVQILAVRPRHYRPPAANVVPTLRAHKVAYQPHVSRSKQILGLILPVGILFLVDAIIEAQSPQMTTPQKPPAIPFGNSICRLRKQQASMSAKGGIDAQREQIVTVSFLPWVEPWWGPW